MSVTDKFRPTLHGDPDIRTRTAFAVGRGVGMLSKAWKQRGLGTIYQALKRLPGLHDARGEVEFMRGAVFETEFFEGYWGLAIVGQRPYEPEIMLALERFRDLARPQGRPRRRGSRAYSRPRLVPSRSPCDRLGYYCW